MNSGAANGDPVVALSEAAILRIVAGYAAAFVVFGLVVDGPAQVLRGLAEIVTTRDALLTDYFGIGGIGGACVNAGLLTLCACFVYRVAGAKINGAAVACLFLVLGFGLFGKNLLNIWSIVLGVFLYARFRGEPFAAHVNTAFFGAALAPVFSEILFTTSLAFEVRLPLAVVTSLVIGFILAPAAAQLFKAHIRLHAVQHGLHRRHRGHAGRRDVQVLRLRAGPGHDLDDGQQRTAGRFPGGRARFDGRRRLVRSTARCRPA